MTRTTRPRSLVRVNASTDVPSGNWPNAVRVTVVAARGSAAASKSAAAAAGSVRMRGSSSDLDEIRDLDWPLLIDAVPDRDPGQARHRARARVGQLHVVGHVDLAEDQIAKAIVAAAMSLEDLRHRHARSFAEALRDEDL